MDLRTAQAAPPYLQSEDGETTWLRADMADSEDGVREIMAEMWSLDGDDVLQLDIGGPVDMHPDPADDEQWIKCEFGDAAARYWEVQA